MGVHHDEPMNAAAAHESTEIHVSGGVVVGDDGSECAAHAVRTAAEEARRRDLPLHVVRAWSITTAVRPADIPRGIVPSVTEFEAATREAETARVRELIGDDLEAQVHVVHAAATSVLLQASQTADLLVVGTRGRGGFSHLLLGSVAEQCIRHAGCSVLVVRD